IGTVRVPPAEPTLQVEVISSPVISSCSAWAAGAAMIASADSASRFSLIDIDVLLVAEWDAPAAEGRRTMRSVDVAQPHHHATCCKRFLLGGGYNFLYGVGGGGELSCMPLKALQPLAAHAHLTRRPAGVPHEIPSATTAGASRTAPLMCRVRHSGRLPPPGRRYVHRPRVRC